MTTRLTTACLAILLLAVAACGSKESSSGPEVVPGAPAGDVREVAGTVTAQRGDEAARTLAVGDVVSGDDLIATSAGSSIVIELRHNGVKWSLAAEFSKRLGDSAAWKAPRRSGEGGATGERSTAAGRHAEREAADTAATAAMSETMEAPTAPTAPPPVEAKPDPAPADVKAADDEADEQAPPPTRKQASKSDKAAKEKMRSPGSGGGATIGSDLPTPTGRPVPADIELKLGKVSSVGARKVISARISALRSCWQQAADSGARDGRFTALLAVDADGKVTKVSGVSDGDANMAESCFNRQFARMKFPAGTEEQVTATLILGIR